MAQVLFVVLPLVYVYVVIARWCSARFMALCGGSLWGGLIPLMFGWVYAYSHVQTRVLPKWLTEEKDRDP